uniref:MATH domain-containing protein n=1 Tax=Steinernema glaseri TaxID=37863 RepID=A0A1I7Y9C4_9BILA
MSHNRVTRARSGPGWMIKLTVETGSGCMIKLTVETGTDGSKGRYLERGALLSFVDFDLAFIDGQI